MPSTLNIRIPKEAVAPQKTIMTMYKIATRQTQLRMKTIGQNQRGAMALKITQMTTRALYDYN